MWGVYKNIDKYNSAKKKQKILIVCDGMIADMISKKKVNPMLTDLFNRGRKLNLSLVFITH